MSGARGSQNFGVRLSLDGAEAVESGLRRVQATAAATGQAVASAGRVQLEASAVTRRSPAPGTRHSGLRRRMETSADEATLCAMGSTARTLHSNRVNSPDVGR